MGPAILYVDYDGVLVDFRRGFRDVTGHYPDAPQWNGKNKYTAVHKAKAFWANLPPTRDFDLLWGFLKNFDPNILTAYADWDEKDSKHEKWQWNLKYTKVAPSHFHCVARQNKKHYAIGPDGKPNVLIDDWKQNVDEWKNNGGLAILHTDAQTTIGWLKHMGFHK